MLPRLAWDRTRTLSSREGLEEPALVERIPSRRRDPRWSGGTRCREIEPSRWSAGSTTEGSPIPTFVLSARQFRHGLPLHSP